jgi:hypothetical protein
MTSADAQATISPSAIPDRRPSAASIPLAAREPSERDQPDQRDDQPDPEAPDDHQDDSDDHDDAAERNPRDTAIALRCSRTPLLPIDLIGRDSLPIPCSKPTSPTQRHDLPCRRSPIHADRRQGRRSRPRALAVAALAREPQPAVGAQRERVAFRSTPLPASGLRYRTAACSEPVLRGRSCAGRCGLPAA